jgi:hypothetical protein
LGLRPPASVDPFTLNLFDKAIYKVAWENLGMSWIIALALFGFWWWCARRGSERAAELAPTGMLRSPLYWMSSALALLLIVLVLYITHIHHQSPVPVFLWFTVFAIIVALLFLRRALKWRYPV